MFQFSDAEETAARNVVSRVFPSAERTVLVRVGIPPEKSERILEQCPGKRAGDTMTILIPQRGDSTLGYTVLDNVLGKDQLITYALTLSSDLTVNDLEVITYREPYGFEIRNKSWRKQFEGKRPEDTIRPGREIRNITGATISVRAVTTGVNRILCILRTIQDRLPGHPSD